MVDGRGGDDVIYGGPGNDVLRGGAGDDRLYGYQGADRLDGGAGNDFLQGGLGPDVLSGGPGEDLADYSTLIGDGAANRQRGGAGRDTIVGGGGRDVLMATRLRPVAEADRPFLLDLYADVRAPELALVPWDEATKRAFVAQQFAAQDAHCSGSGPWASTACTCCWPT